MPSGLVKWFDEKKGFGFILDGSGADIFVHYKAIVGDGFRRLFEDQEVEYEAADGPKGRFALRVRSLGMPGRRPPKAVIIKGPALPA